MLSPNYIGVDAIAINCLDFRRIVEQEKLIDLHRKKPKNIRFVYTDRPQQRGFFVYDGKLVCFIRIQNDLFRELAIGWNEGGSYAKLRMTVTDWLGDNNNNLPLKAYKKFLQYLIRVHLPEKFGIQLGMENAGIESIEINMDVLLDKPYHQYNRVFRLMMSGLKKSLSPLLNAQTQPEKERTDISFDTLCAMNKTEKVILYNKAKESSKNNSKPEQPRAEEQNLLRVEFKLQNAAAIKRRFKTNRLREIDDDRITDYFHNTFMDYFVEPCIKWWNTRFKELKRLIRQSRKKSERKWSTLVMEEIRNRSEKSAYHTSWTLSNCRMRFVIFQTAIEITAEKSKRYWQMKQRLRIMYI